MACEHFFVVREDSDSDILDPFEGVCKKCDQDWHHFQISKKDHVHCWDTDLGRCGAKLSDGSRCNKQMPDCDHIFIFGEKRRRASCLGSHHAHCQKCFLNFFVFVPEEIDRQIEAGKYDRDSFHVHCFDTENGKCGSVLRNGEDCVVIMPGFK